MKAESKNTPKLLFKYPSIKSTEKNKTNCNFIKAVNKLLSKEKKTRQSDCEEDTFNKKHSEDIFSPTNKLEQKPITHSNTLRYNTYKKSNHCQVPINISRIIKNNIKKTYIDMQDYNSNKSINDIMFNKSTRLVSVFKDYLIYDDTTEFCKRFYVKREVKDRIFNLCNFYNTYSKIFANYIILEENEFLYKNIRKKQKAIDRYQDEVDKDKSNTSSWDHQKLLNTVSRCDTISLKSGYQPYNKEENNCFDTLMQSYIKGKPSETSRISNKDDIPLPEMLEKLLKKDKGAIIVKSKVRTIDNEFWNQIKERIRKYKRMKSKKQISRQQNNVIVYNIQLNANDIISRNKNLRLQKRERVESELELHKIIKGGRSSCRLLANPSLTKIEGKRRSQRNRKVQTEITDNLFTITSAFSKSKQPFSSAKCLIRDPKAIPAPSNRKLGHARTDKVLSINIQELCNNLKKQNVQLDSELTRTCSALSDQRNNYLKMVKEKIATHKSNAARFSTQKPVKQFLALKKNGGKFMKKVNKK